MSWQTTEVSNVSSDFLPSVFSILKHLKADLKGGQLNFLRAHTDLTVSYIPPVILGCLLSFSYPVKDFPLC